MKILNRDIKAAIFDLDGTLIDSCGIWAEVDASFFAMFGRKVPDTYLRDIAHVGLQQAAIITRDKYKVDLPCEEMIRIWSELSIEQYEKNVPAKPGAIEYVQSLKKQGIKLALATANDERLYIPCLKRLGIYEDFDIILDVTKVGATKDSPEIYLQAAKALGATPEECAVYEDLPAGMRSAYTSGFLVIGVEDGASKGLDEEKKKCCHLFLKDFTQLL